MLRIVQNIFSAECLKINAIAAATLTSIILKQRINITEKDCNDDRICMMNPLIAIWMFTLRTPQDSFINRKQQFSMVDVSLVVLQLSDTL